MDASAQAACERCGTFSQQRPVLGSRQLCPACVTHLATSTRTWSSRYVTLVGALLTLTTAAVLLALNWQRLGDALRARQLWIGAAALGVGSAFMLLSGLDILRGALLGPGIGLALWLGHGYRDASERLRLAGARSANRWLPVVFTVLVIGGISLTLALPALDHGGFDR